MVGKIDYGGAYDYDEDEYEDDEVELDIGLDHREAHPLDYSPEADLDSDGYDDASAAGFQEQHDRVEHRADYAADDSGLVGFDGGSIWRGRYRRRWGRYVPPDMRQYRWPVFVRFTGLQDQGNG